MARRTWKSLCEEDGARDPRGLKRLVIDHLEWMRVQNYSELTVETRKSYLGYFIHWCAERGITRPTEVTRSILERYRHWLFRYRKKDGKPLSARGQYSQLVPVRALFKWLAKQNHVLYNPAAEIELPRQEKRLPVVLTAQEAERVLNQPDVGRLTGVRDRAILETFYSTGMRRSELMCLKVQEVDLERGTVVIRRGKGRKDRMVPIGQRAVAWIEKYLDDVRPELVVEPDEGVLFLTKTGQAFTRNRLTSLAASYVSAAGIGKRGACHLFRHTMATLMLEGGADIRYIQHMLGHGNLATTETYTQVSIRKLKEVHTETHPGARLERSAPRLEDELSDEYEEAN